jgi:hypothetical protein
MTDHRPPASRMRRRLAAPLIGLLAAMVAVTIVPGGQTAVTRTQAKPSNTALPTVTGTATAGQKLTGAPGTWTGRTPITYTYQWLRCDAKGSGCVSIAGETGTVRLVDSGDVGRRLRFRVRASNADGSATATSAATAVVAPTGPGAPVNTKEPSISGTAAQGQSLAADHGTWSGTAPITYAYQWLRCDANGSACNPIPGETSASRTIAQDDVGHRLRVRVTATNSAGSTTVESNGSAVVTAAGTPAPTPTPGPTGPLPDGAVTLPSGKYSIPVTSVSLPAQLVVDKVKFAPNPVRSRTEAIVVRVHVVDTRGYVVRDALVFVRSVPAVTTTPTELPTGQDGWASFQVFPKPDFPLKRRGFVQFFVRVRKAGDTILVGVGSRRLVQVRTTRA